MKSKLYFLTILFFLLISQIGYSEQAILTWEAPTTNADTEGTCLTSKGDSKWIE